MIEYHLTDPWQQNRRYMFSYQEARSAYRAFCDMPDDEFVEKLPEAIHLAVFISFIKEIPTSDCLSDVGVIHELVHLLAIPDESLRESTLKQVRTLFEHDLRLS
jgi:hypothetical protein